MEPIISTTVRVGLGGNSKTIHVPVPLHEIRRQLGETPFKEVKLIHVAAVPGNDSPTIVAEMGLQALLAISPTEVISELDRLLALPKGGLVEEELSQSDFDLWVKALGELPDLSHAPSEKVLQLIVRHPWDRMSKVHRNEKVLSRSIALGETVAQVCADPAAHVQFLLQFLLNHTRGRAHLETSGGARRVAQTAAMTTLTILFEKRLDAIPNDTGKSVATVATRQLAMQGCPSEVYRTCCVFCWCLVT